MNENKVNDLFESSMEKIREIAGTETVVGDPIYTPNGTLILPVSKISIGFATGGIDYGKKKPATDDESKKPRNFGGGGGTGVSVTPIAFLILSAEGKIDLITVTDAKNIDAIDKVSALIDRSPDILKRLFDVFKKKKDEKETKE